MGILCGWGGEAVERNDRFDSLKRRFFLVTLPLTSLAGLTDWMIHRYEASAVHPTFLPALCIPLALALLLWRKRRSLRFVEAATLTWVVATVLSQFYSILFIQRADSLSRFAGFGPWFSVSLVAIFLVFGQKRAIQIAIGIYGIALVMGLSYMLQHRLNGERPLLLVPLLQLFMANAAFITFLFYYARVRELFDRTSNLARSMADLAHTDALLGIANRRQLYIMLQEEVNMALEGLGKPAMLIMFDLDRFKEVNDTFGHEEGDQVLQDVAKAVQQTLRGTDRFGRWGGDEFMVLAAVSDLSQAQMLAHRLREAVQNRLGDRYWRVTISLGVTPYHRGDSVEAWVKRADQALYRAKETGRNRVVVGS